MTDPDDIEAIALEHQLAALLRASQRLADPEAGLWWYVDLVTATLMHQQAPGRPLSWIMLECARRTTSDILNSL